MFLASAMPVDCMAALAVPCQWMQGKRWPCQRCVKFFLHACIAAGNCGRMQASGREGSGRC
eukprot:1405246-Lingulodinium_polyedra.AAC.1